MSNERGKRGGKSSSKVGKATGRGAKTVSRRGGRGGDRGHIQLLQEDRQSTRRGQAAENRVESRLPSPPGRDSLSLGVISAGATTTESAAISSRETQNARQRNEKRVAEHACTSTEESLGADGVATRGKSGNKAKGDQQRVLWSPGSKRARDIGSAAASGKDDDKNVSRPSLLSLANSFKEAFGEDIGDDSDDREESDEVAQPARIRPRTRSRGNAGSIAEVAATMSPEKIAAEVQKAKARAREERFGAGAKPPGMSTSSAPVPPPKTPSHGEQGGGGSMKTRKRADGSGDHLSSEPENPDGAVSAASSAGEAGSGGTYVTALPGTALPSSQSLAATPVATVSATAFASEPKRSSTRARPEELSSARSMPPPERPTGSGVRGAGGLAPGLHAADKKDVDREKVHTRRLQARTDADGESNHSGSGIEASEGVELLRVEEDSGVEECKGFDPPNLPPRSQRPEPAPPVPVRSPLPRTSATTSASETNPARDSTRAATISASAGAETSEHGESRTPTSPSGKSSWGPSFSIAPAVSSTAGRPLAGSAGKSKNPWVLSSTVPTFAKNRGRPLATAFSNAGRCGSRASSPERPRKLARTSTAPGVGDSRSGAITDGAGSQSGTGSTSGATGLSDGDIRATGAQGVGGENRREASRIHGSGITPVDGEIMGGDLIIEWDGGVVTDITQAAVNSVSTDGEDTVSGMKVAGVAKELLERLRREREESFDLERKLTQALLDL